MLLFIFREGYPGSVVSTEGFIYLGQLVPTLRNDPQLGINPAEIVRFYSLFGEYEISISAKIANLFAGRISDEPIRLRIACNLPQLPRIPPPLPTPAEREQLHPCTRTFYLELSQAQLDGDTLIFRHKIPNSSVSRLLIRESYQRIYELIETGKSNHVILTGTPGIGKSLFLYWMIYKRVKEQKRTVIDNSAIIYYCDEHGNWFQTSNKKLFLTLPDFFTSDLVYLVDAGAPRGDYLEDIVEFGESCFVLSLAPGSTIASRFMNRTPSQLFVLPIWTEKELESIQTFFPKMTHLWKERYNVFGGVPRYVFEILDEVDSPEKIIKNACSACSLDECTSAVSISLSDRNLNVHRLIHMSSEAPYKSSKSVYASETALHIITAMKSEQAHVNMKFLLACVIERPLVVQFLDCMFLLKSGQLPRRSREESDDVMEVTSTTSKSS
jgi:hypothetical protein